MLKSLCLLSLPSFAGVYTTTVISDPIPFNAVVDFGPTGPFGFDSYDIGSGTLSINVPSVAVPPATLVFLTFTLLESGADPGRGGWSVEWSGSGDYLTDSGHDYPLFYTPRVSIGISAPYDGPGTITLDWQSLIPLSEIGGLPIVHITVSESVQLKATMEFGRVDPVATAEPSSLLPLGAGLTYAVRRKLQARC